WRRPVYVRGAGSVAGCQHRRTGCGHVRTDRNLAPDHSKTVDPVCRVTALAATHPDQIRYAKFGGQLVPRERYRLWARVAAGTKYLVVDAAELSPRINGRPRPQEVWQRRGIRAGRTRVGQ